MKYSKLLKQTIISTTQDYLNLSIYIVGNYAFTIVFVTLTLSG